MWLHTVCNREELDWIWLAWEHLRSRGPWPGVFATPSGFAWLLRYGPRGTRPLVLARWQGNRLSGLLPLLVEPAPETQAGAESSGIRVQVPPLAAVPLGEQPTVLLLEVFQNWERWCDRSVSIEQLEPPFAYRSAGRWAVAARWRGWTCQVEQSRWIELLPAKFTGRSVLAGSVPAAEVKLRTDLPESWAADWHALRWHGWSAQAPQSPEAWWELAELLHRHDRLLLVQCGPQNQSPSWLLAAREPWGVVLLALGSAPSRPSPLDGWLPHLQRIAEAASFPRWLLPREWLAPGQKVPGLERVAWRVSPPGGRWQRWWQRLRPGRFSAKEKRRQTALPT